MQIAYLARYGHQPLSEIRAMTLRDAEAFQDALGDLVVMENKKG